jgi:hypothetical protein
MSERSSEVRLIEVAGIVNGVQDWGALLEELRRQAGTLDLPERCVRQAGRLHEMTLSRAARTVRVVSMQCGGDRLVASDHSTLDETIHECLDVVEGGIVPAKAIEVEATVDIRYALVLSIEQRVGRMLTEERPNPEADTKPFTIRWTLCERCARLRPAQRHELSATHP